MSFPLQPVPGRNHNTWRQSKILVTAFKHAVVTELLTVEGCQKREVLPSVSYLSSRMLRYEHHACSALLKGKCVNARTALPLFVITGNAVYLFHFRYLRSIWDYPKIIHRVQNQRAWHFVSCKPHISNLGLLGEPLC